ncbi:helix-turn-helix domain-containing protein [Gemmata sp. JC717]|uniref:helix-turn-helix transcriptional regulator n=1 Tax=Gemmata algarum TaxID=2975278 RepID=UPI0021BAF476|nr:helix-turn-helix domain-containing protein [Gemmata algarum]MDY3551434.1 helix-turn-helix domain-containing protein [Gemmata algarum]
MLNEQDYMTVYETAEALSISRQALYKRLKNGTAPAHIRVGDRTFFERADVEQQAKSKINPARGGDR